MRDSRPDHAAAPRPEERLDRIEAAMRSLMDKYEVLLSERDRAVADATVSKANAEAAWRYADAQKSLADRYREALEEIAEARLYIGTEEWALLDVEEAFAEVQRVARAALAAAASEAAPPAAHDAVFREEGDRYVVECECGWRYEGWTKDDVREAAEREHGRHVFAAGSKPAPLRPAAPVQETE